MTSQPSSSLEGAKHCLNPGDSAKATPRTPDKVRKWRKSNHHEPGKPVLYPGIIDDFAEGHEEGEIFGITASNVSDHVEDVWSQAEGECAKTILEHKESRYKSAQPLGKSCVRQQLPEYMKAESFRHGETTTTSQDDAKSLLYPNRLHEDDQQGEENAKAEANYKKSHGSYEPGQQRSREYNWPVDPKTTIFGDKGKSKCTGSSTGVFEALNMMVQEESLEVTAATATPDLMMVFGRTTKTEATYNSAAECLQFDSGQNKFTEDLGMSNTPGFRNARTTDRIFGQPSIRTDIHQYAHHSLADTQNYGDDVNAEYLLRPSHFASLGLDEDEFKKPRSKDDIKDIFYRCGYIKDDASFDRLFDSVSTSAHVDVETFRNAYNEWSFSKDEASL